MKDNNKFIYEDKIVFGKENFLVDELLKEHSLLSIQIKSFMKYIGEPAIRPNNDFLCRCCDPKNRDALEKFSLDYAFYGKRCRFFPIKIPNYATIHYLGYSYEMPKYPANICKEKKVTYGVPLKIKLAIELEETKEIIEEDVYFGEMPYMTDSATFVFNGNERVIVSQLIRSPGILFTQDKVNESFGCQIRPYQGSWIEMILDSSLVLKVSLDKKKKVPMTYFLKLLPLRNYKDEIENDPENYLAPFYFKSTNELIKHFYNTKKISSDEFDLNLDEILAEDVVIKDITGNLAFHFRSGELLDEETVDILKKNNIKKVEIIDTSKDKITDKFNPVILNTLRLSHSKDFEQWIKEIRELCPGEDENLIELKAIIRYLYSLLRPNDIVNWNDKETYKTSRDTLLQIFFENRIFDFEYVGRYRMNKKLKHLPVYKGDPKKGEFDWETLSIRHLLTEDILESVKYLIYMTEGIKQPDDLDHLSNRRVKLIGEMLFFETKKALARIVKNVQDRLTALIELEKNKPNREMNRPKPSSFIHIKAFNSLLNDFFATGQLSQFLEQTNPLAELTHKRRLSALGPGGLSRERAGFDVRDVHTSHYGRICPIETPEGPNIGLIVSITSLARVNDFGFIETPYRVIKKGKVTEEIEYLDPDREQDQNIISSDTRYNDKTGVILEETISARKNGDLILINKKDANYMDIAPPQLISVSTALIPFLENDDANRALMGSNMQRQSTPILKPQVPLVSTGMEKAVARDSGIVIKALHRGKVIYVDNALIKVETKEKYKEDVYKREGKKRVKIHSKGEQIIDEYNLIKYKPSNQYTSVNQKPLVRLGEEVEKNQVLTTGPAIDKGELALGSNVLVAFMPWEGFNFEDAILISERILKEDVYTSVHIESFDIVARETKLGKEEITKDIPKQNPEALEYLDENGIVKKGTWVKTGDILVGKVTPKSQEELTPELKLLHSIFGEKAEDVEDRSLKLTPGKQGIVIDVYVFSRENKDDLPPGVDKMVRVLVASKKRIAVGDKMAGRHGNKGVISRIMPIEDMPFLEDGTAVDMVLNPLGVPSRMNLGQVLELHLGMAAKKLNKRVITPIFVGAKEQDIKDLLKEAQLPEDGKIELYDGRTGRKFDQKVAVGYMYVMKLNHLAVDKIHARSVGPYSLITQQPLGGKAQFGGQRLGEMEVWTLEAYGAANTLREFMTVKSDDVLGRSIAYSKIVKGDFHIEGQIPESFNVLIKELRGLGLKVDIYDNNNDEVDIDYILIDK